MEQASKFSSAWKWIPRFIERPASRRQIPVACEVLEGRRLLSATAAASAGAALSERPGVTFTADVGSFVTLAPGTGLTARIKWGDGKHSKGVLKADGVVGLDEINFDVDGTHAYRRPGTYSITATVYHSGPTPSPPVRIVASFSDTAIVSRLTRLNGTISGTYSPAPVPVDVGAEYVFNGTGTAGELNAVTAQGTVDLPGFIATGNAAGTLTLTSATASADKAGSVTLKLAGPTEKGFGPFPAALSYTITGGTGDFVGAAGTGSIAVTFGTSNGFTFKITSLLTPTLASA